MLLSYEHRFLFVHVSKAAGTSIQHALEPWAHRPDLMWINRLPGRLGLRVRPLLPHRCRLFREHATLRSIRQWLPRSVFDGCFKFGFVRNPWDWVVSLHSYLLQTPSHRHHAIVKRMTFEQFLHFEAVRNRRSQHDFLVDGSGRLLADFVGRFERLHDDFDVVCRRLGIDARLPVANRSSHRDYRECYDSRTIEIVRRHFQRDIELFGYEFDPRTPVAQPEQARSANLQVEPAHRIVQA